MAPRSRFAQHRRATVFAVAIAAAVTAIILSVPLLLGLRYAGSDLARVDLAALCAIGHQIERGLGLWLSPEMGMGAPLFMSPEAELAYPLRWPLLLLAPDAATSAHVVIHLSIAAAGTAYLARTFRVRPLGASTAGVAFAFCGPALNLIDHTGYYLVSASWLAVAWPAARRCLGRRRRALHVVLLGGALSACLLAGEPQTFAVAAAVAVLECLVLRKRSAARSSVVIAVIAGALAIGFCVWSSALLELSLGRRSGVLSVDDALRWSMTPDTWPGVLWPGVLLKPVYPGVELRQVWFRELVLWSPWDATPYLGALFAASVIVGSGVRRIRIAAGVFWLGLIFSLGSSIPLLGWAMRAVPVLALFRYPAKYLVVTALAGMIVSAAAFEEAARHRARLRRFRLAVGAAVLVELVLAGSLIALRDAIDAAPRALSSRTDHPDLPTLSAMLLSAATSAAVPLAMALVLLFAIKGPRRRAIHLLLAFDYLAAFPDHVALGPPLAERASPMAKIARPEDRVCLELLAELTIHRWEDWSPWIGPANLRQNDAVELQACDGLTSPIVYSPLETRMNEALARTNRISAARALGCTIYAAVRPPEDADAPPLELFGADPREPRVYPIGGAIPDAFVVSAPRFFAGEDPALASVLASKTSTEALSVIDDPLDRLGGEALPQAQGVEVAAFDHPVPHRARIRLRGGGGAVVGFRSAFYRGWRAWQEGHEVPVVRAGGIQVAAVVGDVSRPVDFVYEPPGLGLGLLAFLAGAGVVVASAVAVRRRRWG